MNNQRKQLEKIFIQLFEKDKNYDLALAVSGTTCLETIASAMGEENRIVSLQIVKQLLESVEKNMERKTRAKFCFAMHALLEFCKNSNINENASLAVMIAILILEFAKTNNISIEKPDDKFKYYNKKNGPFLSPSKWSVDDCIKISIDYFLRDFYAMLIEIKLSKNPFAIGYSSFNPTVLERKNMLFLGLLFEYN